MSSLCCLVVSSDSLFDVLTSSPNLILVVSCDVMACDLEAVESRFEDSDEAVETEDDDEDEDEVDDAEEEEDDDDEDDGDDTGELKLSGGVVATVESCCCTSRMGLPAGLLACWCGPCGGVIAFNMLAL